MYIDDDLRVLNDQIEIHEIHDFINKPFIWVLVCQCHKSDRSLSGFT